MSYNYKTCEVLLIVCVMSIICPSKSNLMPTVIQSPIERQMNEKVFVDQNSDSMNTNINKRYDNKIIKKVLGQSKKPSAEPLNLDNLSLYGFASMIDPRSLTSARPQRYRHPAPNNPEYQYNSYQQLFDSMKPSESMNRLQFQEMPFQPNTDEEALHVLKNYMKKYDIKKYFLKKILGDAYDREEGHDEGFFANKHLRRHGGAGMAGKVFGELIGIKIRKTIENFGDTVSDYAKELTTSGFVTIGNTFNKIFRLA